MDSPYHLNKRCWPFAQCAVECDYLALGVEQLINLTFSGCDVEIAILILALYEPDDNRIRVLLDAIDVVCALDTQRGRSTLQAGLRGAKESLGIIERRAFVGLN